VIQWGQLNVPLIAVSHARHVTRGPSPAAWEPFASFQAALRPQAAANGSKRTGCPLCLRQVSDVIIRRHVAPRRLRDPSRRPARRPIGRIEALRVILSPRHLVLWLLATLEFELFFFFPESDETLGCSLMFRRLQTTFETLEMRLFTLRDYLHPSICISSGDASDAMLRVLRT